MGEEICLVNIGRIKKRMFLIPAGLKEKTTIELFSRNGSDYSNFEFRYEKSFKNCIDPPGAGLLHSTPSCSYRRCFIRKIFQNFGSEVRSGRVKMVGSGQDFVTRRFGSGKAESPPAHIYPTIRLWTRPDGSGRESHNTL